MLRRSTVVVLAGRKSSGEPVMEELLVDDLGGGLYRLVITPGVALGLAAGDTVTVGEGGAPRVVRRGGNVALHLYGPHEVADLLTPEVERQLLGTMDGRARNLTVYTVPVSMGFAAIESMLSRFVKAHPEAEWFFANVYDDDGTTPLLWWEEG